METAHINNYGVINRLEAGAMQVTNLYINAQAGADARVPQSAYTDQVVGRAILALNGPGKALCEKQLFLAVIKVLMDKCGWSPKWVDCCNRINALPVAAQMEVKCDYNNLKASIALKFAALDYKEWEGYEPREAERAIFRKNRTVARLFDEELDRQLQAGTQPA